MKKWNTSTNLGPTNFGRVVLALAAFAMATGCFGKSADDTPWARRKISANYCEPPAEGVVSACVYAGGIETTAEELERGRIAYVKNCYACHGMEGNGKGPAAAGLRPPPRDFRKAAFKFGSVPSGELPDDQSLRRIIWHGLEGSAMLTWDIQEDELDAIIQFIKSFPPAACDPVVSGAAQCEKEKKKYADEKKYPYGKVSRWLTRKRDGSPVAIGERVPETKDPWEGKEAEAIAKGQEIYHLKAQCANCHPAYLTKQEFYDVSMKATGEGKTSFRDNMYRSIVLQAKDNPYGVNIMPPDFTINPVRSVRESHRMTDLHRLISSGVGGVMPAWFEGLKQEEIWALTHYVNTLIGVREPPGNADQMALWNRLAKQTAGVTKADGDGDGITDDVDACPKLKGGDSSDPKHKGCPDVELKGNDIVIHQRIQFETGKSKIKEESLVIIDHIAEILKGHEELTKMEIGGHTDSQGDVANNRKLSQDRAAAVKKALVARGVSADRLSAKGYGPDKPLVKNDTDENRAANRRVEFHSVTPDTPKPVDAAKP